MPIDPETKEAIRRVRDHMAAMGHPIDRLTDEQFMDAVDKFGRAVQSFGVSVSEAYRVLAAAGKAAADRAMPPQP